MSKGGYTPVMPTIPQMPRPVPLDQKFADEASKATSGTIPKNILRAWYNADSEFRNNGKEYVDAWREAYIELCVEDGSIGHDWTSEGITRALNHYYDLYYKASLQYSYVHYPEINIFDPDTFSIVPLKPPPKKP